MLSPQSTKLQDAVNRFESQLDQEFAMDDRDAVQPWIEDVRSAFESLDEILGTQRQRVHSKLYRTIAEQNPRELEHIRALQDADRRVAQLLDVVKSQLIAFSIQSTSDVVPRVEQQEQDAVPILEIIDRGTELVHWIREQEALVTTWFAEIFADSPSLEK